MADVREHLLAAGLSPRTVNHYLGAIRRARDWFEAHGLDLSQATATDLASYVEGLPRTWATRNLVRAALTHLWRAEGRHDPPVRALRVPPKPPMTCRALEREDARLLAKTARNHGGREGLAVAVALYMGLRREEVARLRWDALSDGWVTIVGKGDRSRTLPVHPVVVDLLAGIDRGGGPYVFAGRGGGHVNPATVWQWMRDLSVVAGLGQVPTHVARHTMLAEANDRTGDLRSTQHWAGHANPAVTSGYTRTTARRLTAVMEAIDYDAP